MVAAPSARQQGGFFVKGRGLLLFLIFFITLALFIGAGVHYNLATHFQASTGDTLAISGAPGELITITVDAGSSVDSHWASQNGLTLTLNTPSHFSTQLVAPRDPDWSDTISTSMDNPDGDMLLAGSFVLPANLNTTGQALTGQIAGDVEYPDDMGFEFQDSSKNVAVQLQLIPTDASAAFLTLQFPLYAITGLGIVLLLILPAIFRIYDMRRKESLTNVYLS